MARAHQISGPGCRHVHERFHPHGTCPIVVPHNGHRRLGAPDACWDHFAKLGASPQYTKDLQHLGVVLRARLTNEAAPFRHALKLSDTPPREATAPLPHDSRVVIDQKCERYRVDSERFEHARFKFPGDLPERYCKGPQDSSHVFAPWALRRREEDYTCGKCGGVDCDRTKGRRSEAVC